MKITQRPHKYCFSKNPVQYTFAVPEFSSPGCEVIIQIYRRDIGGGSTEMLYEERIKPLTGSVIYNINDIAEASLDYSLPNFAGSMVQNGSNIKEFYVKFAAVTAANPTPLYIDDAAAFLYIIKGGIPQPIWDWNNYFINYVVNNKPFLSWQPDNRFIGLNDDFFLSFLNSMGTVPMSLIVDAEYTDGTPSQTIIDFVDSDQVLYHIHAGPDTFGLNAAFPAKKLYKYSISIVDKSNPVNIFAKPLTYYIDYRQFYHTKFLHYYNSLGGIECVRMRGEIETSVDVSFTDSEKYNGAVVIGSPASEQYTQTAKSKTDSFKGDSGFIHTVKEHDVFQEVLLTKFAWERILNNNWRIYALNKSAKLRSTRDKMRSFGLEWRYSFTNSVYAPMIDLGAGSGSGDYCLPVSIPKPIAMPDGVDGEPYVYSMELTGDLPITLGTVTKPSWMTVTITGNVLSFSGTPDADATALDVSVELKNCTAATKTWATAIDVLCVYMDSSVKFDDAVFNEPYFFALPFLGTGTFTLTDIIKPSWMTIVINANTIEFSGTPDATGVAVPVSGKLVGCNTIEFAGNILIEEGCADYYNNTSGDLEITYTPCGSLSEDTVPLTVIPGASVCGRNFGGTGYGYLIYLGKC